MKYLQSSGLIISIILCISLSGQDAEQKVDCKVLKPEISGQYSGDCRKGLAHGFGKAVGEDTYEGRFKKGFPHGKGTYIFSSGAVFTGRWKKGLRHGAGKLQISVGGRDSVIVGIWKNDGFVRAKITDDKSAYKIVYRKNIDRIRVIPMGRGNEISIRITRNGLPIEVEDLILSGSSGTQIESPYFIGFLNVDFPFNAAVRYQAPSTLRAAYLNCEVEFEIYRPDGWEVNLQH